MSWNKNLNFEETYAKLRLALKATSVENVKFRREDRQTKIAILLIALRNGSRESEAIDAYNQFLQNKSRKQEKIRVRKQGFTYVKNDKGVRHRASTDVLPENPVYKKMMIPEEISENLKPFTTSPASLTEFSQRFFEFNPHALRYAFITYMGSKGISPALIAKITHHKSLDMILKYTEQAKADDILENEVM